MIGLAASDAIDFDAALEAYLKGGDPERLLLAADNVIDCNLPIDPKHTDAISALTDHLDVEIKTYSDAAHAISRWFATTAGPRA
ncbi:MAG TPA: hypothetical protein VG758_13245, partial [Hyphomicrobiaceae bacterium]|nr:hypothetical protein [Hyphomicrobiaceae bacterium]